MSEFAATTAPFCEATEPFVPKSHPLSRKSFTAAQAPRAPHRYDSLDTQPVTSMSSSELMLFSPTIPQRGDKHIIHVGMTPN